MDKLDALGIEAFCERIEAGESQASIARSLSISKARITEWLQADAERSARAKEARARSSESLYELAHDSITSAADTFELAKAREEAQHLRRWAAIRNPQYSEKLTTELVGKDGGAIKHDHTVQLQPETARLLDVLSGRGSDPGDAEAVPD